LTPRPPLPFALDEKEEAQYFGGQGCVDVSHVVLLRDFARARSAENVSA
jgi:hypothetical protein